MAFLSEDENIRMHCYDCQARLTSGLYYFMKTTPHVSTSRSLEVGGGFSKILFYASHFLVSFVLIASSTALAQQITSGKLTKLPSPDKIIGDYLSAIGGKKRVASIKDATYDWTFERDNPEVHGPGSMTLQLKQPASIYAVINYKEDQDIGGGTEHSASKKPPRIRAGANARSAWVDVDGSRLLTLRDDDGQRARLYAMLEASHLADYKKSKILARTVGIRDLSGAPAYVVEFSMRNGARVRYFFSVSSKLVLATEDDAQKLSARRTYSDYREEHGLLEPHVVTLSRNDFVVLTLKLRKVSYNTGLSDALFDPPTAESIDVSALLKEIDRNQDQVDERVGEYTYTEKLTERKINDKGEVTEETVTIYEVYPLPGRNDVRKLISENGVTLSPEKAAKEEKRVMEEMEKAERERNKTALKLERARQKGRPEKPDNDPGIADFLRAAELVSPRRERLREREAIVFDFRPRVGYKPKGSVESIVSKLAGVVWVDPVDKQVIRLEARLIESYKMGGGILASVRPGTALVFEQRRMDDGVWLPVYSQANISAKVLLFKSINVNVVQEFSNYQRFNSNVDDYKLSSP